MHRQFLARTLLIALVLLSGILSYWLINNTRYQASENEIYEEKIVNDQKTFLDIASQYKHLRVKIADCKKQGVDTATYEALLPGIRMTLFYTHNYKAAKGAIDFADHNLDNDLTLHKERERLAEEARRKAEEEERAKGEILGTITCAQAKCPKVSVKLFVGKDAAASLVTSNDGKYSFRIKPGTYSIRADLSGYQSFYQSNIILASQKQVTVNITLKPVVATKRPATASGSSMFPKAKYSCPTGDKATEIGCYLNSYRKENGKAALIIDPVISAVATKHSAWMSANQTVQHSKCDWYAGETCYGEIIAHYPTPSDVFYAWQHSEIHNWMMLRDDFTKMGIGVVNDYYTINFD